MVLVWDPECDLRAKEILYRCLEELGATKAALYLAGDDDSYELVTAYGFGKREAVVAVVRPGDAIYNWIRRHRTTPSYLNDVHDDLALGRALESAGTARLLTIPLTVADRLVGFVDARDKGRRQAFSAEDVIIARKIGEALTSFVNQLGIFGRPETRAEAAAPSLVPQPSSVPAPARPIDRASIEETIAIVHQLGRFPGVAVLAVTITDGATVRTQVLRTLPLEENEREALASHQLRLLEEKGVRVPPPSRWGWNETKIQGDEWRREEIRSAVLHKGPPTWIVASVVTARGSAVADAALEIVARSLSQSVALLDYRRAARNAARALLEPGEQSYPHLRQHSQAVSEIAQRMAALLRLSDADEELVTLGGYLHDVGMRELDYPRAYRMERPGEIERRLYQRHPTIGARLVEAMSFPYDLAGAIRHHHERWDGTGYPHRLAGNAIPISSRIIHLAEVYDVLTSSTSYRRPIGRMDALETVRADAGRQFDPDLIGILEEAARA